MQNLTLTITKGKETETWIFLPDAFLPNIVFVGYFKTEIPKGKRKPVVVYKWDKYAREREQRNPEPPLTDEIKRMVLDKFISMISVVTWDERNSKTA